MKSLSVTIQMKATEQYFPVMLFLIAGPMLIAVFITEMVILHKYVYLLLLLLSCIRSFLHLNL